MNTLKKRSYLKGAVWSIAAGVLAIVVAGVAWYQYQLQPAASDPVDKQIITIEPGATPGTIGDKLAADGIIKSSWAFSTHVKLIGDSDKLQAGNFQVSPNDSTPKIVEQLTTGKAETVVITFFPGATLYDPTDTPEAKRTDVYTVLRKAGYTDEQVRAGLEKTYDHPLLKDKPADATLEGYVYGETYQFKAGVPVADILRHSFDVYYEQLQENQLIAGFKKQGLNLHEGITLASIIEREVQGDADQRQVAQVFYKRLDEGISLGADATFKYAAQQMNVPAAINLESPYNTRIKTGLPPGPISNPGLGALQAAANPASGEFLYFVSGDDGTNHFSKTNAEHEANVEKYCTTLCQEL